MAGRDKAVRVSIVETFVEHSVGEQELINRAYLTLVGLDEQDKPADSPG